MATRHNTAVNPACGLSAAGWGGNTTPARTAVSGFGRSFAARYTSGTVSSSSRGGVTPGAAYVLSEYVHVNNGFASNSGNMFIEWRNAAAGVLSYTSGSYDVPGGVVSRISISGTAPANAAFAQIITDGLNFGIQTVDLTMLLVEVGPLGDYFDGETPGASWDGTPGASSSTLPDVVGAALAAGLPPLTVSAGADVVVPGAVSAVLPALGTSLEGAARVAGTVSAGMPALSASASGTATVAGAAGSTLPSLTAAVAGEVSAPPSGVVAAMMPALTAALAGTSAGADVVPGVMLARQRTSSTAVARTGTGPAMRGDA